MTEKSPELLPLGTAVKIKDDDSLYIIISRGFQKNDDQLLAGYAGVPHPYGEGSKYKKMTIATKDILEVVHRGYEDDLDKDFAQSQLGNAADAPKPLATPAEELSAIPSKVEEKTQSTVQSAPVKKGPEHPYDPFYNLMHKAKENKK